MSARTSRRIVHEYGDLHRLLVERVVDYAIFALDPDGYILTWNQGAERLKGYTAQEAIGNHFSMFYPPEDVAAGKPMRKLEHAAAHGRVEEEGWRVRKDGTRFWASVLITALRDEQGELIGFAKVTRDLTERRAAHERALEDAARIAAEKAARDMAEQRADELRTLTEQLRARTDEVEQKRLEAEEANRAKSEFLAAMSHELRTPLNAIGGYTQLILLGVSGPVTDTQREQLQRIERSQQHLLSIITDILNFSRIEAGRLDYDIRPIVLHEVIDGVTAMILPQVREKGIELKASSCAPQLLASADRPKLEQILLNLLSNAAKFTPEGGVIEVTCGQAPERVWIRVRDTGIGIAPDEIEMIFAPFVQLGRSLTNPKDGAGLGLAISRDLARAMKGELTVESRLGEGSTFTLTLPRA